MQGERLAEQLLQIAVANCISLTERNQRLNVLQLELTALRYGEEAAICAAINNGDDGVSRLGSSPPWAVLQVEVGHELEAAA